MMNRLIDHRPTGRCTDVSFFVLGAATTITWDSIYMSVSYFQQFLGKQARATVQLCDFLGFRLLTIDEGNCFDHKSLLVNDQLFNRLVVQNHCEWGLNNRILSSLPLHFNQRNDH